MSDIEEAPKKKRVWVMTEARKAAFEKCRQKRIESLTTVNKDKQLKKLDAKAAKIEEARKALVPIDSNAKGEVSQPIAPVVDTEVIHKEVRKHKTKATPVNECDSSSESSVELIIKKKERRHKAQKEIVAAPPEASSWYNTAPQYIFL